MNLNCAMDRIQMRDQKDCENAETAKQEHRQAAVRTSGGVFCKLDCAAKL